MESKMKLSLTKKIAFLTIMAGVMFSSQASFAAQENAALSQDWHIALPAELPEVNPEMAALDQ